MLSIFYFNHHAHKLIYHDRMLVPSSLQVSKVVSLKAHHLTAFNVDAYLFRKPAGDRPQLLALHAFLQTRIQSQDRWNPVEGGSCGELSVPPAFVAPCTYWGLLLESPFQYVGKAGEYGAGSRIDILTMISIVSGVEEEGYFIPRLDNSYPEGKRPQDEQSRKDNEHNE